MIRSTNGWATTRLYHKTTWNGQYTNFYSFVPMSYNWSLVRGLANRLHKISSKEFLDSDMLSLKQALLANGYPESFIEHYTKLHQRSSTHEPNKASRRVVRFKFRSKVISEVFRRKVERSIQRNCREVKIAFIFTSAKLLPTPSKDRLAVMSTPNVVYQFTCSTCHLQYIGKTARRLEERVREHMPKWLTGASVGVIKSSITEHIVESGHYCNRDNCFTIIHRARHPAMLKFVEAVAIKRLRPSLNVQQEMDYHLKLPWT